MLRIAICLSGMPKALIQPKLMRAHLLGVLQPLRDNSSRVDVYLHLGCGGLAQDCDHTLRAVADELAARKLTVYQENATLLDTNLTGVPSQHPLGACPAAAAQCCSAGYAAAVKWRGCLRDIEVAEAAVGVAYDFVLRLRPDIEHLLSLPPAREWRSLRRDVAFTMLAIPHAERCHPGDAWPSRRLGGRPVPVTTHGLFVDDNLALLPRHAAQVLFTTILLTTL